MQIDIITLFPEMLESYFGQSILKRAQEADLLNIKLHQLRNHATSKHRITDEPPYGGGGGMVLKPEPLFAAVDTIVSAADGETAPKIILLTPQGKPFTQTMAAELSQAPHLVFVCGRYEGVDERVRQHLVTDEISLGDYVLTGGELGAMVIVDAVARLLPGALGAEGAAETDSHATGLLEGPHYTRPAEFQGHPVPEVLKSGHAANIKQWHREQALRRTWERRPEMLLTAELSEADRRFLAVLALESAEHLATKSSKK